MRIESRHLFLLRLPDDDRKYHADRKQDDVGELRQVQKETHLFFIRRRQRSRWHLLDWIAHIVSPDGKLHRPGASSYTPVNPRSINIWRIISRALKRRFFTVSRGRPVTSAISS